MALTLSSIFLGKILRINASQMQRNTTTMTYKDTEKAHISQITILETHRFTHTLRNETDKKTSLEIVRNLSY